MDLLEKAKLEVEELRRQRDAITAAYDAKIAIVEQTVKLLEPVYSPVPPLTIPVLDDSVGITEAIETALRKYPGKPLAPTAVRDVLAEMKYRINGDNPMASVHQVLKRLVARSGSPYVVEQTDGQTMYKFDPAREPQRPRRMQWDTNVIAQFARDQAAYTTRTAEIIRGIDSSAIAAITGINLEPRTAELFRSISETAERASPSAAIRKKMLESKEKK